MMVNGSLCSLSSDVVAKLDQLMIWVEIKWCAKCYRIQRLEHAVLGTLQQIIPFLFAFMVVL